MKSSSICYKHHRFPTQIIAHAVWLYVRFNLSFREVEEMLLQRGIDVSYETARRWVIKFGPTVARNLRQGQGRPGDVWHLDEVALKIAGRKYWLWRAVDGNGDTLEILVQSRRAAKAAKRFLRKLIKRWLAPRVIVTDKLRSYRFARRELCPSVDHRSHKRLNNRSEASHQHTRRRAEILGRFKSTRQAQMFLSVHDQTTVLFRPKRNRLSATDYRRT